MKTYVGFVLFALISIVTAEMTHPGGWYTQADLTQIRTQVAAGNEPWISGWNDIKGKYADENYKANVSPLIEHHRELSNQGQSAHILAIKWVASGEQKYADAAMALIDAWVDTVTDFDVYGPTLTLSTGAGSMAQAAEILEHGFDGEAGWPASRASAAKTWFRKIIYDKWTNTGKQRSSNWGTSCVGGNMSMAIFCDDIGMFEHQREAYLHGYKDTDDGCASVTDYIIYDSGQAFETGRDQAHVQGGIAHLTEAALCAWNQGVNLVSASNNRLLAGVEYHAKYNLGYDDLPFNTTIPNPCNIWNPGQDVGISEDERGNFSPVYYMSAKLFSLAGLEHPYTKEVLASSGYTPEFSNTAHPGMGSLTHIPLPSNRKFVPKTNVAYYIDSLHHDKRLAASATSKAPYTTSISTTGADVKWRFIAKGNGSWYVHRAAGGKTPRLRLANKEGEPDMKATSFSNSLTYFTFEPSNAIPGSYHITLTDGPSGLERLQMDNSHTLKFVSGSSSGTWESFRFTEVNPSK